MCTGPTADKRADRTWAGNQPNKASMFWARSWGMLNMSPSGATTCSEFSGPPTQAPSPSPTIGPAAWLRKRKNSRCRLCYLLVGARLGGKPVCAASCCYQCCTGKRTNKSVQAPEQPHFRVQFFGFHLRSGEQTTYTSSKQEKPSVGWSAACARSSVRAGPARDGHRLASAPRVRVSGAVPGERAHQRRQKASPRTRAAVRLLEADRFASRNPVGVAGGTVALAS